MTHTCTLKVRPYECDSNAHVNNAVYLNYLETARAQFLEDIGFDYRGFMEKGYGLFVSKINIHFKVPAEMLDTLTIISYPIKKRRTSGIFRQIIKRENEVLCEADVTWACVNSSGRPSKLPEEFQLEGLEVEE